MRPLQPPRLRVVWLEAQIGFVPGVGASSEIYFPLALYAPCSNEVGPGMKDVDARADLR